MRRIASKDYFAKNWNVESFLSMPAEENETDTSLELFVELIALE